MDEYSLREGSLYIPHPQSTMLENAICWKRAKYKLLVLMIMLIALITATPLLPLQNEISLALLSVLLVIILMKSHIVKQFHARKKRLIYCALTIFAGLPQVAGSKPCRTSPTKYSDPTYSHPICPGCEDNPSAYRLQQKEPRLLQPLQSPPLNNFLTLFSAGIVKVRASGTGGIPVTEQTLTSRMAQNPSLIQARQKVLSSPSKILSQQKLLNRTIVGLGTLGQYPRLPTRIGHNARQRSNLHSLAGSPSQHYNATGISHEASMVADTIHAIPGTLYVRDILKTAAIPDPPTAKLAMERYFADVAKAGSHAPFKISGPGRENESKVGGVTRTFFSFQIMGDPEAVVDLLLNYDRADL